MQDKFGRTIDYLRISVTDKCNMRCRYCMPDCGIKLLPHEKILSFEEIERLARLMAFLGVKKIRLTGGEPLVRKNVVALVEKLNGIEGIEEIAMTTNGLLLCDYLEPLKNAGLKRVNLSLDSTSREKFHLISGNPESDFEKVMQSMEKILREKMPLKINAVPTQFHTKEELVNLALLAKENPLDVRFIELMPIGNGKSMKGVGTEKLLSIFEESFGKAIELPGKASETARYFKFEGFSGRIGFISPLSFAFCSHCNRVRLTADGKLKPCLCHEKNLDVRELLRSGKTDDEIKSEIIALINEKPAAHSLKIGSDERRFMNQIGG